MACPCGKGTSETSSEAGGASPSAAAFGPGSCEVRDHRFEGESGTRELSVLETDKRVLREAENVASTEKECHLVRSLCF